VDDVSKETHRKEIEDAVRQKEYETQLLRDDYESKLTAKDVEISKILADAVKTKQELTESHQHIVEELKVDYEKKIEDYEKATHNYRQQIIDLTEKLDKTKGSRDWWYNQYTEMLKDYNALRKKVNEIMLYGGMKIV
jgi:uncharacterized protein YeeX (DUF496 family)